MRAGAQEPARTVDTHSDGKFARDTSIMCKDVYTTFAFQHLEDNKMATKKKTATKKKAVTKKKAGTKKAATKKKGGAKKKKKAAPKKKAAAKKKR